MVKIQCGTVYCLQYDRVLVKSSLHKALPMEIILFKRNKTQLNINPRLVLIGLSTVWQHNLYICPQLLTQVLFLSNLSLII